jgi:ribonuclease D
LSGLTFEAHQQVEHRQTIRAAIKQIANKPQAPGPPRPAQTLKKPGVLQQPQQRQVLTVNVSDNKTVS